MEKKNQQIQFRVASFFFCSLSSVRRQHLFVFRFAEIPINPQRVSNAIHFYCKSTLDEYIKYSFGRPNGVGMCANRSCEYCVHETHWTLINQAAQAVLRCILNYIVGTCKFNFQFLFLPQFTLID